MADKSLHEQSLKQPVMRGQQSWDIEADSFFTCLTFFLNDLVWHAIVLLYHVKSIWWTYTCQGTCRSCCQLCSSLYTLLVAQVRLQNLAHIGTYFWGLFVSCHCLFPFIVSTLIEENDFLLQAFWQWDYSWWLWQRWTSALHDWAIWSIICEFSNSYTSTCT